MSIRPAPTPRRRRVAVAAVVGIALVAPATRAGAQPPPPPPPPTPATAPSATGPTVEIAVLGDRPLTPRQVETATAGTGTVVGTVGALGATLVEVPLPVAMGARARLDALPGVRHAYRPGGVAADLVPTDPLWPTQSSSVAPLGLPAAWDLTTGSSDVVIAVLDSGVDPVPDLAGRLLPGVNFVTPGGTTADDFGHGTATALVAAGAGNDGAGGAGVCWSCRILPVKILDADGLGTLFDVARGIVWAADNGADVINLSLGGRDDDPAVRQALSHAAARGAVVVASTGNDGGTTPNYPAASPGVLSVASLADDHSTLAPWSARGAAWTDVAAPGCNWVALDGATRFCGTSSSAPLVSGIAGLVRSVRPTATREMVATAIVTTAELGALHGQVGYGAVHAGRAVAAAGGVAHGPTPLPVDVTGPAVSVDPMPGYHGGVVQVTVRASDDQGIASVRLHVDGVEVAARAHPGPVTGFSWDTTGRGDGPATLTAMAVDGAGHVAVSPPQVVVVDNAAPLGLLYSPAMFSTVRGSFVAKAVVTDPNGVMGTYIVANDRIVGGWSGGGFGQATVPVTTNGPIRVAAISVDNALRVSATNIVVVKGVAPRRRR